MNVRQDKYSKLLDFMADLETLKQTYTKATATISYPHKELVLKTITEKLLAKAYEEISRKERDQLTNANRALQEQVNFLEKDLSTKKADYEEERMEQQKKYLDAQGEIQQVRTNNKLLEERNKMVEGEKVRVETML